MSNTSELQNKICSFVSAFSLESVTSEICRRALRAFFDTIAAMASGSKMEQIRNTAAALGVDLDSPAENGFTVIGYGRVGASLSDAVLLNGVSAHSCEYNDLFYCLPGHPSAVLVPVCIGLGEKYHKGGREVLEAYICGFEVLGRVNRALMPAHHIKGFHSTSTAGIVGSAVCAAKLLGLSDNELSCALSLAFTFACGLRGNFGYTANSLHVGNAAAGGLRAALYAKAGIGANPELISAKGGYIDAFEGNISKFNDELGLLGKVSAFEDPGLLLKKYPTCYSTYQAIDAAKVLVGEEKVTSDDILSVDILTSPNHYMSLPSRWPESIYGQRFCVPFCVSWVLNGGNADVQSFSCAHYEEEKLKSFSEKVSYGVDPTQEGDTGFGSTMIKLRLRDGRKIERRAFPDPDERVEGWSDEVFNAKLSECFEGILSKENMDALSGDIREYINIEDTALWISERFESEERK